MRKLSKAMLPSSQEEIVKKLIEAAKKDLDIAKKWKEIKADYSHLPELLTTIDLLY